MAWSRSKRHDNWFILGEERCGMWDLSTPVAVHEVPMITFPCVVKILSCQVQSRNEIWPQIGSGPFFCKTMVMSISISIYCKTFQKQILNIMNLAWLAFPVKLMLLTCSKVCWFLANYTAVYLTSREHETRSPEINFHLMLGTFAN